MIDKSRIVDSKSDEKDFNNFSDKGVLVKEEETHYIKFPIFPKQSGCCTCNMCVVFSRVPMKKISKNRKQSQFGNWEFCVRFLNHMAAHCPPLCCFSDY